MRIVGGKYKGKSFQTPPGQSTRPTTDRARETIFNIIGHADWAPDVDGARILDLYAGSGALGLEAMSRGGSFCLFVEAAAGARGIIRENIELFGLFGTTRIHRRSATDLGAKPAGLGEPFNLVFMDPPYDKGLVPPTLEGLKRGGWLADDAILYVETSEQEELDADGWEVLDTRVVASSRLTFLRRA